jgi:elongation factor G
MKYDIEKLRNIGISAHIDSGKTTLTERILFYCDKIHAIHEVRGKDGVGATMDSMELEKERGITISSAATNVDWADKTINIIDTPGHVDFTVEVENALRVLDGAVLVLCSVAGVQSQTMTVDRQLKRYNVPRIAFVNKCDRAGANPLKVAEQIHDKLGHTPVILELPIGLGDQFEGIIDIVKMKAVYFDGPNGENIRYEEIPDNLKNAADEKREEMLDVLGMFSDELAEAFLEGNETEEMIISTIRKATIAQEITPVLLGSAYKNKGVQILLDAVVNYLPSPTDIENTAFDLDNDEKEIVLSSDIKAPTVALAFKLDNQTYGQLTYVRIYQGMIRKGDDLYNTRAKKRFKVGRLVRMLSDEMQELEVAYSGDIVALFGVDCALGDTFVKEGFNISLKPTFVPNPIISLAIKPLNKKSADNMSKALNRFTKEDPTFKTYMDEETNETIISGMGELHLDVYIERMKREYKCEVETGQPQVAYRETISKEINYDYTHKKQSGGRGQYAKLAGIYRPIESTEGKFVNDIKGGVIPGQFIPACEKGFYKAMLKGSLIEAPIVGVEMVVNDGNYHPVDSSAQAFETASLMSFRSHYQKAAPVILEPIMKLSIDSPSEFRGNVLGSVSQRRGLVISTDIDDAYTKIIAEVPLSEVFGYATVLRSLTQGKAEFTLEFLKYSKVPKSIAEEIEKKYKENKDN